MSHFIFLLWLLSFPLTAQSISAPEVRGYLLNCGAGSLDKMTSGNLKFITDEGFTSVGNKSAINNPDLVPVLSTVRYFPDTTARKYCYEFPATKGGKYLVRTTYYYGGFDGGKEPPVFDQIVDGTKWSTVNTSADYAQGLSSYYELVVVATMKTLSVCLARNKMTVSSPFISALEVVYLEDSMYNSTDFSKYALRTVARSIFGSRGDLMSYPDDQYNRLWQPFTDNNPTVVSQSSIISSDFWNFPPTRSFQTAITTSQAQVLQLQWPPGPLPATFYYIALYFQDDRTPSPNSWRVFNITLNGSSFYPDLNVTTRGVTVYATMWQLSGLTQIVLTPAAGTPVGPVINAGEVYQIQPLGGRTIAKDVMAMYDLARNLEKPPPDWSGDPCLPKDNSWTGVTCSIIGKYARVVTVNLTNAGLNGSLPSTIAMLSGLKHFWLGGNKLSGHIPEMGSMQSLQTLHLENNKLEGRIPSSLGRLPKLREIFLQNNNVDTIIPISLRKRKDIFILLSPKQIYTPA